MDFFTALLQVRNYHDNIWFRSAGMTGNDPELRSSEWKGATLVSATGRILAFQTGHCCEWQLTPAHCGPADRQTENDSDADWPTGDGF